MAQCYHINPDGTVVTAPAWTKCPTTNSCCVGGDECLADHICHFTHNTTGSASYSTYYLSNCIDPTFTDPDCLKTCQAEPHPDIVYDYANHDWACCGVDDAGNVNCTNVTNITFDAPAPASLATLTSSLTSSTSTSSTSISSTSASSTSISSTQTPAAATATTSQPSPSSTHSASGGLSSGAKAGIGVGVALGAVAVIILIAWILLRRRSNQREDENTKEMPFQNHEPYTDDADYNELRGDKSPLHPDQGKQGYYGLAEMDGSAAHSGRAEVSADNG